MIHHPIVLAGLMIAVPCLGAMADQEERWETARSRGLIYADCGRNVNRLLAGWIDLKRDPQTHLYSRGGVWDYHNEAADHYSSLVLMAFYTKASLIEEGGTLHQTLVNSRRLCDTPSGIPVVYDLRTHARGEPASLAALSEWLRDGLIRIVELLGTENDWYLETERLTDAMIAEAEKRGGMVQAFEGSEPWGNMLQTLARLHAASGKQMYLEAAEEIADAVLLDPRWEIRSVKFGDHGCELVPGLGELFVLEWKLDRPKARLYHRPMRELLDRILLSGVNPETGLFSETVEDKDGKLQWKQPPDTWGYVLFSYENYDRATGENRYRQAIEKPLRWLVENRDRYPQLKHDLWPRSTSSDDWSDSHESMIVLWNRYRDVQGVFEWLDWATLQHKHRKFSNRTYGPFDGGHFDGSTGRSLCIQMMVCSQGVRHVPFAEGVRVGCVQENGRLLISIEAEKAYQGRLCFDGPRTEHIHATIDWARLNEMPQWFVARPEKEYSVVIDDREPLLLGGERLIDGLPVEIAPGRSARIEVRPIR